VASANRGTLALFISLGRFRLIGTYNQFFYTPQSSQSHSYLLRFSIPMRNCRLVSLFQAFIPTSGIQTPMPSTCFFSLRLLTLHHDYHLPFLFSATGRPMLSSEYNSPRTRHDLYTPTLLFFLSKSIIVFLALRRTMYDPFMFSTLLSSFTTPRVSLLVAYSLRLLPSSNLFISTR
jgi:hypothetical protein